MPAYSISLVLRPQAVLPCPRDGEGVWAAQTPPPAPLLMYWKERAFVADASCPSWAASHYIIGTERSCIAQTRRRPTSASACWTFTTIAARMT
jgi:hypothetical protein